MGFISNSFLVHYEFASLKKLFFELGKSNFRKFVPDNKDAIAVFWHSVLEGPEKFPTPSFTAISDNGVSHSPGSNDTHPSNRLISFLKFGNIQSKNKGRTLKSPPGIAHCFKFSGTTQVLPGRDSKTHSARDV